MAKYHGQRGRIYLSTTGTGAAVAATALSSWSLNMTTEKVPVTSFEDTNLTYVPGKKDIQGAFSGFWDQSYDSLWTAADSTDGVKLYLYPSLDAVTKYWYGPAWLDASIECGVDGAITVSGTFMANGSWGRL